MKKILIAMLLGLALLEGCAAGQSAPEAVSPSSSESAPAPQSQASAKPEPAPSSSEAPTPEAPEPSAIEAKEKQLAVRNGERTVVFALNGSAAADALYEQLPLEPEVDNFSNNEKIFYPPDKLDCTGAPMAEGGAGVLAYYAPWGDVVMFYGSFSSGSGLYALGTAVSGAEYIPQLLGTLQITPLAEPGSEAEAQQPETGAKALVVYFSRTGTTRGVADEIAAQTGADVFEIVPAQSYTSDYNTLLDIARREQDENARPAITGSVEDISQYDTIYLGWPCWWSDMPMVVCTFLNSYDLSGKTIAPFVTSGGSGFGSSLSRLRELEPGATVTEGLSLQGSGSSDAVSQWLNSIGPAQ